MKKYFVFALAALGLMTACSEERMEEPVQSDKTTIAFTMQDKGAATRSAETVSTLSGFTVNALNTDKSTLFSDVVFSYNASEGMFLSDKLYYWPVGNALNFYAINSPGSKTLDANSVPQYAYSDWAGETDLVAATSLAGSKKVPYPLMFQHILSQVLISAEAENTTSELTYKLVSVEMTTPSSGTYSFANSTGGFGSWEIDNDSGKTYSYADALPVIFAQNGKATASSTYWNILPVTEGAIKFKVGYQVYQQDKLIADYTNGSEKECTIDNPNLASGKRYVFNFKLSLASKNYIGFNIQMGEWDEEQTDDLTPTTPESTVEDGSAKAVDMGLSVKWADRNVGASAKHEIGRYFAWGQTVGYTADEVSEHNSQHDYIFSSSVYSETYAASINHNLSVDDNTDAARINMGGKWRMPTRDEFIELYNPDNCTKEIKQYDGVSGYEFTSLKTGNKVFLPYTGACNPGIFSTTTGGFYWTSTNHNYSTAIMFAIASSECEILGYERYVGEAIRAVCE